MYICNFESYCQISLHRDYTSYVSIVLLNSQRHHYCWFRQSVFIRLTQIFMLSHPLLFISFSCLALDYGFFDLLKSRSFRISFSEFLLGVTSLFCLSEDVFTCPLSQNNPRLRILFSQYPKVLPFLLLESPVSI